MVFTFTTEDGVEKMTLAEYHRRPELMEKFGLMANPPAGRSTLFLGTEIFSFPDEWLAQNPRKARVFEELCETFWRNPLAYYVPHSSVVRDFLNWRANDLSRTYKILLAGNGCGKSLAAYIDVMLDIIPCDPKWPIFTVHGVRYRKYNGPFTNGGVACISYEKKNLETTIWEQVIKVWTPREFIADYLNGQRRIAWQRMPKVYIADTPVFFYAIEQGQAAFESQALNIYWWDEQGDEARFNGANMRVRRRGGRHVQSLTPHAIQGRPDTGAGSYIHRIYKGELDVGCDVRFFEMSIDGIPDWVYREEDKHRAIREWIDEPTRTGNMKKLAEGMARIHGKFHERSNLVFDDWNRQIHVISPFVVPSHWTFYRYHDHGRKEPNAAILVAVNEQGEYFIVNEYYERGKEISENARGIIKLMTGNDIVMTEMGRPVEVARDGGRYIVKTVSDPRSLSKKQDNNERTIQEEYATHGLNLAPGSGQPVDRLIPLAAELLRVDPDRKHYETGQKGAPRLYVFSNCVNFVREIESYRYREERVISGGAIVRREKPIMRDDHLMTCLMLLAADKPVYIPQDMRADDYDIYARGNFSCDAVISIAGY